MKKKLTYALFLSLSTAVTFAQEEAPTVEQRLQQVEEKVNKKSPFKISGYIQTDLVVGGNDLNSLKVGKGRSESDGNADLLRFGVRRGRIKFAYTDPLGGGAVIQLDATEKGISFKDVYYSIMDPWTKCFGLTAGIFDRPFGSEISYSSSRRESPERSTVVQTLFPNERDLGAMLTVTGPKGSLWNRFALQTGLFAGNGIMADVSNHKDWISHLTYKQTFDNIQFGVGGSFYLGKTISDADKMYTFSDNQWKSEDVAKGTGATRMYWGLDGQFSLSSSWGLTSIRAEVIGGQQPGAAGDSKSPNGTISGSPLYVRNFLGYYAYLIQDIGSSKFSAVLKYDSYDPNTRVSGDDITLKGDIAVSNLGVGALYRANANIRVMAYYDFGFNEKTTRVSDYNRDRNDNVFTLRIQYKF